MRGLAEIGPVVQDEVEGASAHRLAPARFAGLERPALRDSPALCKVGAQRPNTTQLQVTLEDKADGLGLARIDDQLAVGHVIAEGRIAAHPDALLLGGRELVADTLAGDLTLELGERQQHVQGEAPMEVVVLNDCVTETKVTPLRSKHLHQPGKVHQRAAEPVDLVDYDHVDFPGFDVGKKLPQGRSFQRAAGVTAIVIADWNSDPAFRFLTNDISGTGLALASRLLKSCSSPSSVDLRV